MRINDKVLNETPDVKSLIDKMNTTIDGKPIKRIDDYHNFKDRVDLFRESITRCICQIKLLKVHNLHGVTMRLD